MINKKKGSGIKSRDYSEGVYLERPITKPLSWGPTTKGGKGPKKPCPQQGEGRTALKHLTTTGRKYSNEKNEINCPPNKEERRQAQTLYEKADRAGVGGKLKTRKVAT